MGWGGILAGLRDLDQLVAARLIASDAVPALEPVAERYAIAVTDTVAALVDRTDPSDPIARQFIPDAREAITLPQERADPIGDAAHSPIPGIVHRYPDRVLLKLLHACPVYCRFCFRREMVGPGGEALDGPALDAAITYIAEHPAIWEVILTGGDPLMLSPRRLKSVIDRLAAIPHVGLVRIHSRVPVVDPDRITVDLVTALKAAKPVWLLIHTNHPRELTGPAVPAIARLADAGIPLLSQSVLLRGVNDDVATLTQLMRRLVELRITPHYLHHGDLAPGTSHFRLTIAEGQRLVAALQGRLSGLCQPRYVLDLPGGAGKVPIGASALSATDDGWQLTDWQGQTHRYVDG